MDERSESTELQGYRPVNEGPRGRRPPRRAAPGERPGGSAGRAPRRQRWASGVGALSVAALLLLALAGCNSEVFFEIEVESFDDRGCNPAPNLTGFVLDLGRSPGNYDQCFRSPCTRSGGETYECVAGFETPAVVPGDSIHIRLGLYVNATTVGACAMGGNQSIEEGDTITLNLTCGQGLCRPAIPVSMCPSVGE